MRTSQEGAGYTFYSAGGAYRNGVARPFKDKIQVEQMWHILVQRLKNVALLGPGQNHSHQAATAAAMVMNEFTHLDVQACYRSSRYISNFLR